MHEESAALREALAALESAKDRAAELLAAELPKPPAELAEAEASAVSALCALALAVNKWADLSQAYAHAARRLLPRLANRSQEAGARLEEAP